MPSENKPKRLSLSVKSSFKASHSLVGFETPHFHLWCVSAQFEADLPLKSDRLIDMVLVQQTLEQIHQPIEGQYLNTALPFSPTSENLALWFWDHLVNKLPDAPLFSIEVRLCDLTGRETGAAKIYR